MGTQTFDPRAEVIEVVSALSMRWEDHPRIGDPTAEATANWLGDLADKAVADGQGQTTYRRVVELLLPAAVLDSESLDAVLDDLHGAAQRLASEWHGPECMERSWLSRHNTGCECQERNVYDRDTAVEGLVRTVAATLLMTSEQAWSQMCPSPLSAVSV